jgi:hypothetical protein
MQLQMQLLAGVGLNLHALVEMGTKSVKMTAFDYGFHCLEVPQNILFIATSGLKLVIKSNACPRN